MPPSALVIWSAKARGGFIETLFIGLFALLITVRWVKAKDLKLMPLFWIGLFLGFGWWVNNQIIYFMLPIGFVALAAFLSLSASLTFRISSAIQALFVGLSAFIIGGLPFWLYNIRNDFVSFAMFQSSGGKDVLSQLGGVFSDALPILLGAKRFWHTRDLFFAASIFVCIIYSALLLYCLLKFRKELLRLICFKVDAQNIFGILLLFIFACLAVFSISSFGYLSQAPRYLLPLYAGLLPLLGVLIHNIADKKPLAAKLVLVLLVVINLLSSYLGGRAIPGEPFVFKGERVAKDHGPLINWLKDNNIRWVRTNYWIGYRLAFETDEAVRFLIVQKPYQVRIPAYQKAGLALGKDTMPFVLVPAQAAIIKEALNTLGISFKEKLIAGYHVLYDLKTPEAALKELESNRVSFSASVNNEVAELAGDGLLDTRWASATPQTPGMVFRATLDTPETLRAIKYDMGSWIHDYPRGLSLKLIFADGRVEEIISAEAFRAVRFLVEYDSTWTLYLNRSGVKAVELTQVNEHHFFDWSIAELKLFTGS